MTDKKHIIKILKELQDHAGWQYLRDEVMQNDILKAALDMAENKPITSDEFNFKRGAMFAAKGFADMPEQVINQLSQEIVFDDALAASKEEDEN
jgi:hypothetical protein